MGGATTDIGRSIVLDASGNVYTTGYFNVTADFDPGAGTYNLTSAGLDDIFISKLDASGNFIWAKRMGGANYDYGVSIAIDTFGNVYTTGDFYGIGDFDPGAGTYNLTPAGNADIFISKLDGSGNFIWAKRMGGGNADIGYSIVLDASGNVYTTGYFYVTADFDPGAGTYNLTSTGGTDIFISKLDALGNFIWAKSIGGISNDVGLSITLDASGNVYTTGYFQGTADFDPGAGTYNLTGSNFISKLDGSGNFIWSISMGGTGSLAGYSIAIDTPGNVYTTGGFTGTADFDPGAGTYNLTSVGGDIFVLKLCQTTATPGAIFGTSAICSGTSNTYSVTAVSGATSYTWTLPGGWTGASTTDSITTTASATSGNITVTANNTCGNSTASSLAITVNTTPSTPGAIFGTSTICSSTSNTYSITSVAGATSYTWTLPGGWSGTSTTNSITTTASAISGNITVTANNVCGNSAVSSLTITVVNTIPSTPGAISGTTTICSGTSNAYSVTAVSGATSYTWTLPGGWSGTSTTDSITTAASAISGNVTITANNACGTSAISSLAITVNACAGIGNNNEPIINIYPNPTEQIIYITGLENGIYNFSISNILGQVIKVGKLTGDGMVDLDIISNGTYYLKIENRFWKIIKK